MEDFLPVRNKTRKGLTVGTWLGLYMENDESCLRLIPCEIAGINEDPLRHFPATAFQVVGVENNQDGYFIKCEKFECVDIIGGKSGLYYSGNKSSRELGLNPGISVYPAKDEKIDETTWLTAELERLSQQKKDLYSTLQRVEAEYEDTLREYRQCVDDMVQPS